MGLGEVGVVSSCSFSLTRQVLLTFYNADRDLMMIIIIMMFLTMMSNDDNDDDVLSWS